MSGWGTGNPTLEKRERWDTPSVMRATIRLQRPQEVQQVLNVRGLQGAEFVDDGASFRSGAAVRMDRLDQIGRAAVVEEVKALAQSPQRSGAELFGCGSALIDAIRQARAHVVQGEVGIRVVGHV